MRWILTCLAPLLFWIAQTAFKTKTFRTKKWVMSSYRLAADTGHRGALSTYGHILHLHGDGVASKIQGAIYLQRAADMGDMKAQFQMGKIFEQGFEHYFQPNQEKALYYYRLAAKQDHVLAINRLSDDDELAVKSDP
ncbi:MAG: sel1 repeat family protein [Motiliproteus sp.]|nr:sel1 repeat family protein [Motiliproteus sp.]MCW9052738.1 sel1 repeat family protein [Motiliproteus sp.]